ncbi:peptidase M24, structural domain-containing protein [Polychytrium aggregatum]|uniref:peptidase M24, structural domain-containing protein n=1 Tax=Polychytrium aggregatum TaxID=110093 RepID=UPI0022FF2EA0|nr:peptidase M24, structural domain-containing protein [Polychytrium aggregatum]KAI9203495.1 peptidase M24, structural domain-containing protein [Polychytrium aggregatum]
MSEENATAAAAPVVEEDVNALTPNNVTKYQTAADIANRSLANVLSAVADGVLVVDLCKVGDDAIVEISKTVYNKGKVNKGIAFPTTVSINNIICHLSPLPGDQEAALVIKNGDLVRIELGAHVDGYIAQVAHTVVVGASKEAPVTGRQADVLQAAYLASEAAIRLLKPGKTNYDVTEAVEKIVQDFDCNPIEGMLSHQIQKDVLDGPKQIVLNPTEQQRKEIETFTFEEGQVYSIDILISTGEGKPKTQETRTTIFKRNAGLNYQLKMRTSRVVFSEVTSKFGNMAFSLRQFEDEKKARMGMIELANHNLVIPYNVLYEKEDAHVAHFMYTVLLMPNGPLKITSFPWSEELVKSEKELKNEELKELLKQPVRASKKKNNKKTR